MECNDFPEVGTRLTYGEAIPVYDRFERSMLEKAYGAGLLPAAGLYDLLWQLESLAQKFGIEGKGGLLKAQEGDSVVFEREDRSGERGERREVLPLQNQSALKQHDETHLSRSESTETSLLMTSTKLSSCFRKRPQRATSTAIRIRATGWSELPTSKKKTLS